MAQILWSEIHPPRSVWCRLTALSQRMQDFSAWCASVCLNHPSFSVRSRGPTPVPQPCAGTHSGAGLPPCSFSGFHFVSFRSLGQISSHLSLRRDLSGKLQLIFSRNREKSFVGPQKIWGADEWTNAITVWKPVLPTPCPFCNSLEALAPASPQASAPQAWGRQCLRPEDWVWVTKTTFPIVSERKDGVTLFPGGHTYGPTLTRCASCVLAFARSRHCWG